MEIRVQNAQEERNNPIINTDIQLLNNMGFDRTMINKIYLLFNPQNIENAINYMIEINGIYQHNFIGNIDPNENNLCFICKKSRQNHINYNPEESLNDNQTEINLISETPNLEYLNQEKNNINNEIGLDECKVCYGLINNEDKENNKIKCGHLFCKNCWFNYLRYLILESKVDKIKCMDVGCNQIISEDFILKHISEDDNLIQKYKKFNSKI